MKQQSFTDAVRRTAERYDMDLSRPLALVSGGPDSVALLLALVGIGGKPIVLHVDHGLRGEESRQDAEFVRALCSRLGVVCEVRRAELGRGNLQDEARRERYRLSEEVAGTFGLTTVATGHTSDDVAETVLMNLARGAGLRGLSGIPPVREPLVRPLIECSRRDVLRYLEDLGQPYRTDATNLTSKYARNRVRLEVLPVLESLYPGAGGNISRGASLLRENLEALEKLASVRIQDQDGEVILSLDEKGETPPALLRHAIRLAYAKLASGESQLDSATIEHLLALSDKRSGTSLTSLPGGVTAAVRFGGEISFYRDRVVLPAERELVLGEQDFGGWTLSVDEVGRFDAGDAARLEVAYLDASRGPYRVRVAREGDSIRPLGLGGEKKVFRAMMDRKVPKDRRRKTPVVVDESGRVAWVFMGETGEEFKVDPAVEKILRLEVRKTRGDV